MLRKRKYHSFAFAKVNLTLRILSKLKYGYHRIQSFIIFLNLKDKNQLLELLPSGESGLQIMKFINASVNSSKNNSIWTDLSSI